MYTWNGILKASAAGVAVMLVVAAPGFADDLKDTDSHNAAGFGATLNGNELEQNRGGSIYSLNISDLASNSAGNTLNGGDYTGAASAAGSFIGNGMFTNVQVTGNLNNVSVANTVTINIDNEPNAR